MSVTIDPSKDPSGEPPSDLDSGASGQLSAPPGPTGDDAEEAGRGRSAVVYRDWDDQGRPIARKVFVGERLSKLVFYVLTGSGNPYTWCRSAMDTAVARRRVLTHLVRFWFGDLLRLPRTVGNTWNKKYCVNELQSEFVDGHHAPLRGVDPGAGKLLQQLRGEIMAPLQEHLIESGFDGLVWQAGKGNPVAAANYMFDASPQGTGWIWVDLESGVPALFALNPLATLSFYLPKCLHHRRWMFDDTDVPKLRAYVAGAREQIAQSLGADIAEEIDAAIDELDQHQNAWRSLGWTERSISSALAREKITDEQAIFYRKHTGRWFLRRLTNACSSGARLLVGLPSKLIKRLTAIRWGHFARAAWLFTLSHRFRWHLARRYVGLRMRSWRKRRFLGAEDAAELRRELRADDASAYLTDFVVHLGIKVPVKITAFLVIPGLVNFQVLPPVALLLIPLCGAIGRTLYTLPRIIASGLRGTRMPWIALVVGVLPVLGNVAFPVQLLYTTGAKSGKLARFIIYDSLALTGRTIPIWGGPDSLVEHWFNRIGDFVVALTRPLNLRQSGQRSD